MRGCEKAVALAIGVCLLSLDVAKAQDPAGAMPFAGSQVFRRLVLHDLFKLTPLPRLEELGKHPRQSLVIVFGETQTLPQARLTGQWLEDFRARGGAVLIASDRPDDSLLLPWGLRISGKLVHQSKEAAYREHEGCPIIDRFTDVRYPLFQGLAGRLATNQPSYLIPDNTHLQVLARFPPNCWTPRDRGVREGLGGQAIFIAASNQALNPRERVLVIAGHGVFMNGMMVQSDNDNFRFACNCVRWLTDEGKRKRVLFLEEGTVQGSFDAPLKELPLPPIPPIQVVNKIIRGLEEENLFNRLLDRIREGIWRGVALLLSGLLLVYGLARLLRARHATESGVPLLAGGIVPTAADLPVMNQRYRDVVRGGNLWEAARGLARTCFDKVGEPWQGHQAGHVPAMVMAAGWRKRLRLARQVRQLWGLAHGRPVTVTPGQFARVAAQVQEVQTALADGTLRFEETAAH